MAPVGVALIGGGLFIKNEHMPAVMNTDLLSLKAIWSRSLKSAEDTASLVTKTDTKPDLYSSDSGVGKTYHDLLLREDISAVILALPIVSQPEYIEAALTAGKHVLAEKPVAKDVATAKKLIDYYHKEAASKKVTFSVAENFRFMDRFTWAAEQARKLGKVTHFNVSVMSLMTPDNKYYKTSWRTTPEYQGGFLLDGGVHFAAGLRIFLQDDTAASVQAFTALTQPFLPPIDTVNAIVRTASGATGTYQHSAGSQLQAQDWDVACEGGSVRVCGDKVTVRTAATGEEAVREFERTSGVKEEVKAWAQGLVSGKMDPMFAPEMALGDLEFLEKMFLSGEQNGTTQQYELQ